MAINALNFSRPEEYAGARVDFTPLSEIGNAIAAARQKQRLAEAVAAATGPDGKIDANAIGTSLAKLGMTRDAMPFVQMGQTAQFHKDSLAHQGAQLAETRRYHDISAGNQRIAQELQKQQFDFQRQQAAEAAKGFDYREVDDGQGGKALVRIQKATGQIDRPQISGTETVPQNPFAPAGKMTESQSKDALYAGRMIASEKVLRGVEGVGTSWMQRRAGDISDKTGLNIRNNDYQKFDQAQRDFINATLRRESGAVISPAEFDNANKQYFPMPGDTADVIAQKRANRAEAIRGIGAGAGPNWRPDSTFAPDGSIINNPAPKRGESKARTISKEDVRSARSNPAAALEQAKSAIASGADRNAVINRLRQLGIDPSGL